MIDFRLLTFWELCKQRSYTKTAQVLNITQPTVTGHIQYLEQRYGTKLVQYEGKKVTITKEGEILLNAFLTMQSDSQRVIERMKSIGKQKQVLRVGATMTIGEYVLPSAIEEYLEEFPEVEFSLYMGNTSHLLSEMKQGKLDCVFVEGYFNKQEFDYEILVEDDFIGICSPQDQKSKQLKRLDEALSNTLILREEGSGTREILERILHEKSVTVESFAKKIEISNLNIIKRMVEQNRGISFVYRYVVKEELEQKKLLELKLADCSGRHEYNFVVLKDSLYREEYFEFFKYIKSKLLKDIQREIHSV